LGISNNKKKGRKEKKIHLWSRKGLNVQGGILDTSRGQREKKALPLGGAIEFALSTGGKTQKSSGIQTVFFQLKEKKKTQGGVEKKKPRHGRTPGSCAEFGKPLKKGNKATKEKWPN